MDFGVIRTLVPQLSLLPGHGQRPLCPSMTYLCHRPNHQGQDENLWDRVPRQSFRP